MITDKFGRTASYLRLAVVDRCNLRCTYCMPADGLEWLPKAELMTPMEILRLCRIFTEMGVDKIRITGGEPFLRKDLLPLLKEITRLSGVRDVGITTNGLLTEQYIPHLKAIGIRSINLSLDTLDPERFFSISRRHGLERVLNTLNSLIKHGFDIKINTVVMGNTNIADIVPLINLTRNHPISVRFIEEMPFNGDIHSATTTWTASHITDYIRQHFPLLKKNSRQAHSTSCSYAIPGHQGDIGIIAAYTRSFCGDCNRLRLTPYGLLKTCLYRADGVNLKTAIRQGYDDDDLKQMIRQAVWDKATDGWKAENLSASRAATYQSMATIGG